MFEEQLAGNIEGNTKYLLKYISITKVARKSEGLLDDRRLNYKMNSYQKQIGGREANYDLCTGVCCGRALRGYHMRSFYFSGNRYEKLSQIKMSEEGFKTNQ